jgi:uncharacterized protein GlcG (DUF336 family)
LSKSNLTIHLDAEMIRRARVVAAKRGTSVSAMVARELGELVEEDTRYEAAQARAEELLRKARTRGGRSWQRADLHDR